MQDRATVWLVGMMGAGKSAIGRALAERLGWPFLDTDAEIERGLGASVAAIFAREGEAAFRAREREAIGKVAGSATVVALGGGAIAQPGVAQWLARTGTVVFLRTGAETLLARIGEKAERPLLAGLDPAARLARLRELLAERERHYSTASIVVDTDRLDVSEVAEALDRRLATREGS